jgi:MFS family permease
VLPAMSRSTVTLLTLCGTQFLVVLDVTIVAIALPDVRAALGFSPADLQWVLSAYALAFGGLLVAAGFFVYYGLRTVVAFGSRRAWLWVCAMLLPGCGVPVVLALTLAVHRACRAHGIPTGLLGPRI